MGARSVSTDDTEPNSTDESPRSTAVPNPLAGNVRLTLPGQARSRPAGPPRVGSEPKADEFNHLVGDDEGESSEPDEPASQAAVSGTDDGGDDEVRGDTADESDDSADSFGDDGPAGPGTDRKLIKVIGVSVAAVVALATTVWFSSRPPEQPEKPAGRPVSQPVGAAVPPVGKQTVQDDVLAATFTAECVGQTDPKLAASTDPRSAWTCPTDGVPFGQKLVATLPKPHVITGICFWPGFQGAGADGRDAWFHHRVITDAQVVFNDIDKTLVPLKPGGTRAEFCQPLNRVLASVMEFTVMSSDPPPIEPKLTPTSAPPGAPAGAQPDLGELFPSDAPRGEQAGENNPDAASIALWGFKLIGHPVP